MKKGKEIHLTGTQGKEERIRSQKIGHVFHEKSEMPGLEG